MIKKLLFLTSFSIMAVVAASCTQSPASTVNIETTPRPAETMIVESRSDPTSTPDLGISSAEIAMLSPITDWHNRWSKAVRQFDKDDLETELAEIIAKIEDRLDEPLVSMVALYHFCHLILNNIKNDHALRAATFFIDSDLDDTYMANPCDLPEESDVPESLTKELTLLELQCVSISIADQFLSEARILAERTWLKPDGPTVIVESSISESGLVSLFSDWHQQWGFALSLSDEEELIKRLDTLNSSIKDKLDEPLASAVNVYALSHMVTYMISSNIVFRAVDLHINAGLESDSVATLCDLLDGATIPDDLQSDADLLGIECLTIEMADVFLDYTRWNAEETWLKPFISK